MVVALAVCSILAAGPLATTVAAGKPLPPPADISFSGYQWAVKQSAGRVGPGPNYFSGANVRVDAAGLHLSITKSGNKWSTAEVINRASLGYGTYTWTLATPVDALDPSVVLGLFTWNDNPAYAHREVDIEFARWANAADPTNAQYTVQPYDAAGHLRRFIQPAGAGPSVHSFRWAPGSIAFESRRADGSLIDAWTYAGGDVPVPGGENARMNLWLFRGARPTDGRSVEIVISSFSYVP
jgi:hypothetical protein